MTSGRPTGAAERIVRVAKAIWKQAKRNERRICEKVLAKAVTSGSRKAAVITGVSRQQNHRTADRMRKRLLAGAAKDILRTAETVNRRLGAIARREHVAAIVDNVFGPQTTDGDRAAATARGWAQAATVGALERRVSRHWSLSTQGVEAAREVRRLRSECRREKRTTITGGLQIQRLYGLSTDELNILAEYTKTGVHNGWILLTSRLAGRVETALEELGTVTHTERLAAAADCRPTEIQRRAHDWPWLTRCGHNRWALTRWNVPEYRNITNAVVEELKKNDGEAAVGEVMRSVAARSGVRPESVRAYMRSPVFEQSNGHVRVAESRTLKLQPLHERVDGFTSDGEPFIVIPIDGTRLLQGFSCNNVPYELAAHAGCKPETKLKMEVIEPAGCPALTWSWRITSTSGIAIGRLSHVYRKLKLQPGDHLKVIVDHESKARLVRLPPGSWKPQDSLRKRRSRPAS